MYPTKALTGGGRIGKGCGGFLYKTEGGFSSNCFIYAGGLTFRTESRTFKIKGLALPADIGQDDKEIFMKRFQKLLAVLALAVVTMMALAGCTIKIETLPTTWKESRTREFFAQRQITSDHVYMEIKMHSGFSYMIYEVDGEDKRVQTTASNGKNMGTAYKNGVYVDIYSGEVVSSEADIERHKRILDAADASLKIPSDSDEITAFYVVPNEDEADKTYTECIHLKTGDIREYTFDEKGELVSIQSKLAGTGFWSKFPIKAIRRRC